MEKEKIDRFIDAFRSAMYQEFSVSEEGMVANAPGQSGNPESPFYDNLFKDWSEDIYFPVYYSKRKIENHLYKKTLLKP